MSAYSVVNSHVNAALHTCMRARAGGSSVCAAARVRVRLCMVVVESVHKQVCLCDLCMLERVSASAGKSIVCLLHGSDLLVDLSATILLPQCRIQTSAAWWAVDDLGLESHVHL
jgi:hypothetical protein